ncbi:hypothetical protein [Ralstonia wenshanensis]|uniref:hypothetical protein n=1 Tax=Ralstonia wenshanensis TaxID=2842456 RepID=UPI0039C62836
MTRIATPNQLAMRAQNAMLRLIGMILVVGVLAGQATAGEIPDVVLQYADAFAQSPAEAERLPSGQSLRDEYAMSFFQGFTHPSGGSFTKSALMNDAYMRGQAYWRDYPSERDKIFAGYGYVAVEREGVWSHGFEVSAFRPADANGEEWWISPLGDGAWSDVGLDKVRLKDRQLRLRIAGYVSPKGRYGHLGAYARAVLVTSAAPVDTGNQPLPTAMSQVFFDHLTFYSHAIAPYVCEDVPNIDWLNSGAEFSTLNIASVDARERLSNPALGGWTAIAVVKPCGVHPVFAFASSAAN